MFILETPPPLMGNNVPKQMPTCMHYLPQPCNFHFRWIIVILTFLPLYVQFENAQMQLLQTMQCFPCNVLHAT